ncbi:MAG: monovalent cation/H+ antiporter complex subunit F [Pseudomonadota bacterium]
MTDWLLIIAALTLVSVAAALWRVASGPTTVDRMMGAQLVGTSGVAILILLAPTSRSGWAALDVAVVLALLAAFASIAFVKAVSRDGRGDPEEDA